MTELDTVDTAGNLGANETKLSDLQMDKDGNTDSLAEETSLASSSSSTCQSPSLSRTESTTSSQRELIHDEKADQAPSPCKSPHTGAPPTSQTKGRVSTDGSKTGSSGNSVKSKLRNPLTLFKKKSEKSKEREEKQVKFEKMLQAVKVETLPQLFVTKYIGFKTTKGLYGSKYTREAAEDLISEVGSSEAQKKLPLTQLHISIRGIHVTEHKQNVSTKSLPDSGLVPIEFLSYGVQDIRYTKVFTFILVRELSSRTRSLECHAYLCDSSVTCRKLALSMALAFQEYAKNMKDKPHKFEVDLSTENMIEHGEMDDREKVLQDTEFEA